MTGTRPKPAQARPGDMARQVEALTAVIFSVLDRLGRVEETLAVLAERAGLTAPPIDMAERTTTKQAAYDLGCSPSRVRQLIDDGSLKMDKVGGRLLIDAASVAKLARERNPNRA